MEANLENSAVATGLEKVSFHTNPKEGNAKKCSNYPTIFLISHTSISCFIVSSSLQPHGLYIACQAPLSMGFSRQEYTEDLYKKGTNDT